MSVWKVFVFMFFIKIIETEYDGKMKKSEFLILNDESKSSNQVCNFNNHVPSNKSV